MTFKKYQQKQSFLLPPSFSDFLGESHEAVILSEFIHEMDLSSLEQSYNNENGGRSAYHPAMLLSVLVYAYSNGIFSSRKIAKRLSQDLAFMYLSGKSTPDFRTLSRFRKEKGAHFQSIFVDVVKRAKDLGLVSFGTCSLDGTKIYASASRGKNESQESIEKKIREIMEEVQSIDDMEDELYGDEEDANDPILKTKEGREKRRKELEKKKKKEEGKLKKINDLNLPNKETKVNMTDSDSKLMQMKRKDWANGYNVQSITENGIILSNSIFNIAGDQNTLIPSLQKLQEKHQSPGIILADKGYSTEDNYSFCEQGNIDAYIPIYCQQVDISRYSYDEGKDTYTDQEGRVYCFKQHEERRDGTKKRGRPRGIKKKEDSRQFHDLYKTTTYRHIDEKTKKKKHLSISKIWQEHVRKQKEKLSTIKGKQLYKQRMHDVEGVFANIKKNLGFTSFNLRGFKGVGSEWTLISLAHNLKKII